MTQGSFAGTGRSGAVDEDVRVELPAEAGSAGRARRHLRRTLERSPAGAGVPEAVAADAEVCLSELVTNALLHAGTDLVVRVGLTPAVLRLEVSDGSPVVPQWVPRSLTASTGRGLRLITALSVARGGDVHPDGRGKTVWCELALTGRDADADPADEAAAGPGTGGVEVDAALQEEIDALLASEWSSVPDPAPDPPAPAPEGIRLLRYPLRRGVRMREHREAVLRELRLLTLTHAITDPATAARAGAVGDALAVEYAGHLKPGQVQILQALAAGRDSADLVYAVLPGHRERLERWREGDVELERLSAAIGVAVLASPADLRELMDWIVTEFARQLDGHAPRPWTGPLD
ncbi:putative anti-sigma regulatory factor, serine/threonine protein kinase [Kineococcus radiotolerans SRS30216 = ATCC BAA-149]|uniref:Anti-sigma regulatory factor, serine/threonine protein kinase n=1 Tax=Kineococcus radiotolerans (strain ATCC BAA-149 / DSM 14245 / SRS30216) TaxID=266940 RepID=A6W4I4_KINRD|nr:putative anti-sigma regulatory factor, serine/threonine protein kinase [Kineococcus radiotolerans SRS30216 = ATCC BAA-149]